MAEFPALPLWTDAYLGDTTHLTCFEHGAYLLLLITAWRTRDGMLPNNPDLLARYARVTRGQWKKIAPTILAFFDIEDGKLVQSRLRDELSHVRQLRESQAANGRASALKRKARHSTKRPTKRQPPHPDPHPDMFPKGNTPHTPQPEWDDFVAHRKRIGKPLTPKAITLNLNKLAALALEGHDPRAVLNQSIMNGWTGLFGVKDDRAGKGSAWEHIPEVLQ